MAWDRRDKDTRLVADGGVDLSDDDHTILVVDDDDAFTEAVEFWLEPELSVRLAHDGSKAVDEYDPSVDVVLLDLRMPTVSGKETLEQIRAEEGSTGVAIVTATNPEEKIVEMDLDAYLHKPAIRENLIEMVETLLKRKQYPDDIQTLFRLRVKLEHLQETYRDDELTENSQYQRLVTEFRQTHDRVEQGLAELDKSERRKLQQTAEELLD